MAPAKPLDSPELMLDGQGFPAAGGRALELPPKERAVLALLLLRRPAVVSKTEFADAIWAAHTMSDESLARCISRLRRVLAPLGVAIDSVYGTGYRITDTAPVAVHARLLAAARVEPPVAEAYLRARQLAQTRTPVALKRATAMLRGLIATHPDYTPAQVALADALAAAVGWGLVDTVPAVDEGLRLLDDAERAAPSTPGLASARAYLLDLAWRFDAAAAAHRQALRDAPDDADTLLLHGRHLLVTGDAVRAVEALRAAVQRQPHAVLLRLMLARALAHAGQAAEALDEAHRTRADHPDSAVAAIYRLGLIAYVRPDAAVLAAAWRAAEAFDAPPLALSMVSYTLARLGRHAESLEVVDAALRCAGSSEGTAVLHVAALLEIGKCARAEALLHEAEAARCGLLPMVLRDPANAALWQRAGVRQLAARIFGATATGG